MRRHTHGMHAERLEVHSYFPQRLYRIGMHPGTLLARHGGHFRQRLNHSGFVVRQHHRNQSGRIAQSGLRIREIDPPVAVHRQFAQLPAATRQILRRFRHTGMLDGADDNLAGLQVSRRAAHEQIVRFRATGNEHHLRGLHIHQTRDLFARLVHRQARASAEIVAARRVAIVVPQIRQHFPQHRLVERCCCVMVEVGLHRPRPHASA